MYLSKPTERTAQRMKLYVVWTLIMVCPRVFISCNKCTALVGGADNGGGCA